jgi:glycosyltransferase involved in cell wall biosynthesis
VNPVPPSPPSAKGWYARACIRSGQCSHSGLQSVFAQTYPHIEIIAVDDGSSDRSVEILESYSDRVALVEQKNSDAAAARNRGVRVARGKWIAFLDADDLWAPNKIQRQLDVRGHCLWSYTDSIFMGGVNDGRKDSDLNEKYQGRVLEMLVRNNFLCVSSVLIEREAHLDAGGFSESLQSITTLGRGCLFFPRIHSRAFCRR